MRTFLNRIKDETLDELKTSLENLWQRMIQLSEFFQYSFVLILKLKCLVGASRVRCGESGTPSLHVLSIRNGAVDVTNLCVMLLWVGQTRFYRTPNNINRIIKNCSTNGMLKY